MSRPAFTKRILRGPIRDAGAHFEIPAVQPAGDDAGRGGTSSLRSAWRLIARGWAWLGDSLIGDVIGCACLVGSILIFIFFLEVLG